MQHVREIIVDSFAGGGGASTGIELALGRSPDVAINHDAAALSMHRANHPDTVHLTTDIWGVDPATVAGGRKIGLLWASPTCTHFSKAKGGALVDRNIRDLAWVVCKWAELPRATKPRVIILENVEEFCFPPETTVLSKRGIVPIGSLAVGDEVWTHNARWKPVTAISRRTSSTVRIAGYGNSIIETTPNHEFYVRQTAPRITASGKFGRHEKRLLEPEWVRADRLADLDESSAYTRQYSGFNWATPRELPRYWQRMPNALGVDVDAPAFFYMLGRWLGDGWVRKRSGRTDQNLVRICANLAEADALEQRLAATGLTWARGRHSEKVDVFDLTAPASRILIPWLRGNFSEYAHAKTLPAWIFGASEQQRWSLIEGYLDADGHEQAGNLIASTSVSRCLAVGIKLLLQSLGISASVSSVPAREARNIRSDGTIQRREAFTVSWRRTNDWEKCERSDLHIWGRVRSVEPGREEAEVVDITVSDDHSFIADGQVVHNCGWGPVGEDGRPIKEFKGVTYEAWVQRLKIAGYKVQWRELRACDYGAPTIRKRLFVIARSDGKPIVWPKPTHGDPKSEAVRKGKLLPWRTAAECIDWSLPCPSIFETSAEIMAKHGLRAKRPLADATLRRIARGIMRYVVDSPRPFIVPTTHPRDVRTHDSLDPLPTVTNGDGGRGGEHALVMPFVSYAQQGGGNRPADAPLHTLCASPKDQNTIVAATMVQTGYGERPGQDPRCLDIEAPVGTQVAGGSKHAVVAAFLAQNNAGPRNEGISGREVDAPISTVTVTGAQQQLVAASLTLFNGNGTGAELDEPAPTITANSYVKRPGGAAPIGLMAASLANLRGTNAAGAAVDEPARTVTAGGNHAGLVAAFLCKYYGAGDPSQAADEPLHTVTAKPRHGLVTVEIDGATYAIVDIGMRMLTPRERFLAQGFPPDYEIANGIGEDGEAVPLTLDAQGRACGNSVCPPLAQALVAANCGDLAVQPEAEVA